MWSLNGKRFVSIQVTDAHLICKLYIRYNYSFHDRSSFFGVILAVFGITVWQPLHGIDRTALWAVFCITVLAARPSELYSLSRCGPYGANCYCQVHHIMITAIQSLKGFGLIYFTSVSARLRLYRRSVTDYKIHTDERTQVHSARSSLTVTLWKWCRLINMASMFGCVTEALLWWTALSAHLVKHLLESVLRNGKHCEWRAVLFSTS